MIQFFIPGEPKPRKAPTFGLKRAYHQEGPNTAWHDRIHVSALQHRPEHPLAGPIRLDITFFFHRPKDKKYIGVEYKTSRPDWDNLCKLLMDALNGVIFVDDAQACDVRITKKYGEPGVMITVEEIESLTTSFQRA